LLCDQSLRACRAAHVADGALLDTLRRVRGFGAGFLRLDLRQESTRHTQALSEITRALAVGDYATWDEPTRQAFLLRELQNPSTWPNDFSPSADTQEVLATFATAARMGEESLGAYVISMTRQASDVLAVALLQKQAGVTPPMRIVPLFETIADLQAAERTLAQLFALPWYRDFCGERQEVMIGYSDSAKDRGRLMAAFTLYEAQERIAKLAASQHIALTFFHGRGGSVGRGGGSTHLAIASQAAGTVQGRLRVTEQGEMIQAKFALPGVAFRTLEIYCEATLQATLLPPPPPKPEWREAMTRVCARAAETYEATVKGNASFIPYFRQATPIEELSTLNIGSRPARRNALLGVEGLRAIPWVFSWTQTRLHLPVWLGLAEGFATVDTALLQTMYADWPFFRAVVDLIAMVLAKAEPEIAAHYDALLVAPELRSLGEALRQQLAAATAAVLRVMQSQTLLDGNPALSRAIEVRNPYIDPLSLLQAEFLRRMRAGDASEVLHDALLISVNGIANGMRNTG
jgi:phosphoenolpyruvate carboxylase